MSILANSPTFEKAKEYLNQSWNIIPLGFKSKVANGKALISTGHITIDEKGVVKGSWESFQKKQVTHDLLQAWWNYAPKSNIGIVTGKISNLIVVDIDPKNGGNESFKKLHLPQTYMVKTGGDGAHYYYNWPHHTLAPNKIGYLPGVDLKGDGGYVVAPPSIHDKTLKTYEAVNFIEDITNAPEWLMNLTKDEIPAWEKWANGAPDGHRHEAAASVCGKILYELDQEKWETDGWRQLSEWNKRNLPPLTEKDLRATFEGIMKRARESAKNEDLKSKALSADSIVKLILKDDLILFHNAQQDGYIRIKIGEHYETLKINSRVFGQIVNKKIWDKWHRSISSETIKQTLAVLEAKAVHEGETHDLSLRITEKDGSFWYDMGDKKWTAIKIEHTGWSLISETPILFRRFSHQQAQFEPSINGNALVFLEYLNILDKQQQTLVLIYLIASFVPGISHPVLILHGEQGSAKSTALRLIRRLVDPSATELLSFSKSHDNLIQQLSHHYAAYYDNLSGISNDISDLLCRAVTGESYSKRVLYTDDDDMIFNFRSCLALNGINVVAFRSDLLDRSILIRLDRIDPSKRKSEKELISNFEKDRPIILGGIFDTLSHAMKLKDSIIVTDVPRMADFFLWGCAIAEALDIGQDAFTQAYKANELVKHQQVANENPVAMHILQFMKKRFFFEGTAQKLFKELSFEVEYGAQKDYYWPKAANALMRKINEIKPDLKALGVEIQESRGEERSLVITYNNKPSEPSYRQEEDRRSDDNDDVLPEASEQQSLQIN
ncbi:hypothetical protein A3E97_01590 [Candidatus Uhrbacteria bacterium RIFCSPHIGHO2_12_FULL_47_12]|uniref:DNA primase/polymerase bifunctional N-terminal domain-containing protein n=1 Tax=Candidatus Uhrbacteria bacterium RIFCSPLOWO2_02_FULL_48_18 TaxID=1802408 RepID=A0A1F7VE27_9BACT|nr:MAG: hypothetical protein A3E97_01590 [Candidatus Uhrbacteria bacterium RIFCSPHIGHO2_12_FULL_47_12]OGL80580.1 MAG: hypothetical protein A3B20_04240 [Candidatus Uhrbacteria bacterium RIFCSPLOWO2_01_FULL_47_17]OGL88237.1 MAG: hypothetical protein A3I41_00740 [Candidatus Uhrbacteria bacterium RIFCSPLOWO2_02_FULL_48_18]HLC20438.1 bifunctional DNA primase/polymerase [Candidatus Nanoarchaeia archaeon]